MTVERNIPDEKLFSALYYLWVSLGRQPSYAEVQKPACPFHVTTFERRFGSWRQTLEPFVTYANSEELLPPNAVATQTASVSRQTSRSPDLRLRFKVLQRDHFRCCACGASPSLTPSVLLEVDHITPWSKGGETTFENLQTLCFACNQVRQITSEISQAAQPTHQARRNDTCGQVLHYDISVLKTLSV